MRFSTPCLQKFFVLSDNETWFVAVRFKKSPHLFPHNFAKLHPSFWNLFSFSVLSKREPPPLCFGTIPSTSLAVGGMCWEPKFENFHRSYEEPFYFFSRQEGGVYQKNLRIWKKSLFWIKTGRCFWKMNQWLCRQQQAYQFAALKKSLYTFKGRFKGGEENNFSFFGKIRSMPKFERDSLCRKQPPQSMFWLSEKYPSFL